MHVDAARCAETQNRCPWQKVIERFFLDRVDTIPTRPAIGCEDQTVSATRPNKTQAPLPIIQLASPGTKVALDFTVRTSVPIAAFYSLYGIDAVHVILHRLQMY